MPNKSGGKQTKDSKASNGQAAEDPRVLMSKSLQFLQHLAKQQQIISQQNLLKTAAAAEHKAAMHHNHKSAHQR